jgi:septal ring factor EnvC (AmiA/AmiB activator)
MASSDRSMIVKINLYTLQYDEKTEGLRDKTYSELIKEHGHGKIKCSCMNRVYDLSSQFVKSHFDTQKHKKWVAESQKDYIKHFGHCCSQQDIINLLNKELRELKCNITHLTNKNKALAHENIKLEVVNRSLHVEIKALKDQSSEGENEIFMECNL